MATTTKSKKKKVTNAELFNDTSDLPVRGLFNQFIEEKKALGLTQDTIKSYNITFDKFEKYFGDRADLAGNITSHLFIEWTNAMRSEGLAIASINHHLGGIRPFIYWCMEDIRRYVPYFRIRLVNKGQDEIPKHYDIKDVHKLLRKPEKKATFIEWRNWAVVSFIMGTSARVATIVNVRMKDIDLKEGTVFYEHTKNKKLQTANIPPQLIVDLTDYIKMWRTMDSDGYAISEDDYLFCNNSNEQLSRDALKMSFSKYAKERGASKTSLHGLRHTFAKIWYENDGDVVQLSKVLGHSTLHMSQHYMNAYANSKKERFIECNPLETLSRGKRNAIKGIKRTDD